MIVIDSSGSMRKGDIVGAKTRLKAVWLAIANDYILRRLEEGEADLHDVVTIVTFADNARVILSQEPTSWVLYNEICNVCES